MRSHIVWLGYNVNSCVIIGIFHIWCAVAIRLVYAGPSLWVAGVIPVSLAVKMCGSRVWGSYVRNGYGGCHAGVQPVYFQCR
jgi:hypothetical protein